MQSGKPKRVIIKIQSGRRSKWQEALNPKKQKPKTQKAPTTTKKSRAQNDINLHISEARKRKLEGGPKRGREERWGTERKQEVAQQPGDKEDGGWDPATR